MIFTIIALSDKLDGISARVTKQTSKFGVIYDGFTDFVLIVSSHIVGYMGGILNFFWILLFIIPTIVIPVTKVLYFAKTKKPFSGAFDKITVGLSYVVIVSLIIDFIYKLHILVLATIIAYIYMIWELHKSLR